MSIVKNTPNFLKHSEKSFTTLLNKTINAIHDPATLGIYVYLASKPENWKISQAELQKRFGKGSDFIKARLSDLKHIGLLKSVSIRDENNKIIRWETILFNEPQIFEKPSDEDEEPSNGAGLKSLKNGKARRVENPPSGKHSHLEKPPTTNKRDIKIKERDIGTPSELPVDNSSSQEEKPNKQKKLLGEFTIDQMLADNPFDIDEELIGDWIKTRKKKRAAITKTAWKYINTALKDCLDNGIEPLVAFEMMVASGWQSLKVEYLLNKPSDSIKISSKTKQENEKIRQREIEAQQQKREEIGQSKQLKNILSEAGVKATNELLKKVGSKRREV